MSNSLGLKRSKRLKRPKIILIYVTLFFSCFACLAQSRVVYPADWWTKIPRTQAKSWEILPQDAKEGEVILSKRTSLGVFSNLAHSEFYFDGQKYSSIEALWQMMKYPDPLIDHDPRKRSFDWKYSRAQVYDLSGFEAKYAGRDANKIMKQLQLNWISYLGKRFNYKDYSTGSKIHFQLIKKATLAKINQNDDLKNLLLQTKGLILKPDHKRKKNLPKSYYYEQILMDIRDNL